jgi:RNA ligase
MTNKRSAPYSHADGSNCWTKNCSLGNRAQSKDLTSFKAELEEQFKAVTAAHKNVVLLSDIAPLEEFESELEAGYIRKQTHPTLPYDIYNYAEITQFSRRWNDVTLASRGLIVNRETGEVIGRCLTKFFNYGEQDIDVEDLNGKLVVSEKMDGSCGISYPTPDGLAIATRGSFTSEQAIHATEILQTRYAGTWKPKADTTYIWEIIYPENRIVVDYGQMDDIVLLTAVNNKTGITTPASEVKEWKGLKVEEFTYDNMEAVANSGERKNHEGFVVHYRDSDLRIKYKHKEYVEHHKIVSGVSSKSIWRMLKDKQDLKSWTVVLPDEFTKYVQNTASDLQSQYDTKLKSLEEKYKSTRQDVGASISDRKSLVAYLQQNHKADFNLILALHDKRNDKIEKALWESIEPAFEKVQF